MMKTFRDIVLIVGLCLLGVIIYSNSLNNSFHFDDLSFILNNPAITKIGQVGVIFNYWPARFIGFFSFACNYKIQGFEVFGYHLVNLAGHILTSIVVFWLLNLTFSAPVIRTNLICQHKKAISFFVAAIFLVHPVQTEPVNYIFQRVTILAAFLYLLSLCLYIKAALLKAQENRAGTFYYSLSLAAAFMAIFSKENTATLPFAILLYDFCFLKTPKRLKIKLILPFFLLPLLSVLILYAARPVVFTDVKRFFENPQANAASYFLTQGRVMLTYLRLFLLPVRQNLDYDYPLMRHIWDMRVLTSFSILILIIISGVRMFFRYRLMSFGIFWFFLTLLPESSIIPLLDPIYEHRLYLPLVGCSIFLVTAVYYFLKGKQLRLAVMLLYLVLALCAILTYNRNSVWKTEISLWDDVVGKSPEKVRPHNERGLAYLGRAEYDKAIMDFTKAVGLDHGYADGFYNRANAYENQGKYDKAVIDYTQAIRINANYLKAYLNRGRAYYFSKEYAKCILDFKRAIEISPLDARGYSGLGSSYCAIGNYKEAIITLHKAIELNPDIAVAYYNLAAAYYAAKQYGLAIQYCGKAAALGYKVSPAFLELLRPYRR